MTADDIEPPTQLAAAMQDELWPPPDIQQQTVPVGQSLGSSHAMFTQ